MSYQQNPNNPQAQLQQQYAYAQVQAQAAAQAQVQQAANQAQTAAQSQMARYTGAQVGGQRQPAHPVDPALETLRHDLFNVMAYANNLVIPKPSLETHSALQLLSDARLHYAASDPAPTTLAAGIPPPPVALPTTSGGSITLPPSQQPQLQHYLGRGTGNLLDHLLLGREPKYVTPGSGDPHVSKSAARAPTGMQSRIVPTLYRAPFIMPGAMEMRLEALGKRHGIAVSTAAVDAMKTVAMEYARTLSRELINQADKKRDLGKWAVAASQLVQTSDPEKVKVNADLLTKHTVDVVTEAFQLTRHHPTVSPDTLPVTIPPLPTVTTPVSQVKVDGEPPLLHVTMQDLYAAAKKKPMWANSHSLAKYQNELAKRVEFKNKK